MNISDIEWNSDYLTNPKTYTISYFKEKYCEQINSYYINILNFSVLMMVLNVLFILLNKFLPLKIKLYYKLFDTKISFLKWFSYIEIDNYLFFEISKIFECALWVRIILLFLLERGIS